jgi:hypothetical protein
VGVIVFFLVGAVWKMWEEVACPRCVRKRLLGLAGINLLTTHLFWPILVLPWLIANWIRTRRPGHSEQALIALGLLPPPAPPARPDRPPLRERSPLVYRLWGAAQLLLGAPLPVLAVWLLAREWFRMDLPEQILAALGIGLAGGLAFYLCYAGASKLALAHPPLKRRLLVAALAGLSCCLASPLLVRAYWWVEEPRVAGAVAAGRPGALYEYGHYVPPPMWRPEALARFVDWRVEQARARGEWFTRSDLETVRRNLDRHRPGDPAFADIRRKIDDTLKNLPPRR